MSSLTAVFVIPVVALGLWALFDGARGAAEAAHGLSHATVKVWDTAGPWSDSLGLTAGASIEDGAGLTGHGTGSPTIVTVYARGSHPSGPSGLSYWNPDSNVFVWFGKTVGFPSGVDINREGPALPAVSPVFGNFAFGPGDVWIAGRQNEPLYVHLAGSNRFRTYGTESPLAPSSAKAWGVKVDPKTGYVYLGQPAEGRITRLDPVTGRYATWAVGGGPAYLTLDSAGRPYSILSHSDAILRIDPGADGMIGTGDDTATFWRVPSLDGRASFTPVLPVSEEYANGIAADADGNIWFTESNSNEIGRLSGGPDGVLGTADDVICEYTTPELANPQQVATAGSGSLLQVSFTEGEGNSVSVLTPAEADTAGAPTRVCTTVPAESFAVPAFLGGTAMFDEEVTPLQTVITPTIHDLPGLDGFGILRFSPMPNPLQSADGSPIGDAGNGFPSGMTGVYAGHRIAGTYLKGNKHFVVESGAILAPPAPPPTVTRFEEGAATYAPSSPWFEVTSASTGVTLSGDRAQAAQVAGATATFSFTGIGVSWISFRCEVCGIARVFVDGSLVGTVDTFAPTRDSASSALFTTSGLPNGSHALVIEVAGTKNLSSGSTFIVVDAFDVTS